MSLFFFQFLLPSDLTQFVKLNISSLIDKSPRSVELQFNVLKLSTVNDDPAEVYIQIDLQRVPVYHLMSTYIPTLSLIIIVELTLFFDDSQLQPALALSLTIMLVMYTMFQAVQADVPKTAFMLFMDYWLTFCLIVPFVVFLVEIFWELDRVKKEKNVKNNKPGVGWFTEDQAKAYISRKTLVQCIIISLTICFIFLYSALAIYYYNTPQD
jgi:hypothetical protein